MRENIKEKAKSAKESIYHEVDSITSRTVFNEMYQNHNIKIINDLKKMTLYIDGEAQDNIAGIFLKESGANLFGKIIDGEEIITVAVKGRVIDGILTREVRGTKFEVYVKELFFGSFYLERKSQKRYRKRKNWSKNWAQGMDKIRSNIKVGGMANIKK